MAAGTHDELSAHETLNAIGRIVGPERLPELRAKLREDRLELLAHGRRLGAGRQARPDAEPVPLPLGKGARLGIHQRRQPHVGADAGLDSGECRRRHAHDLKLAAVNRHPPSDGAGIGAEPRLPVAVADDGDGMSTLCLVVLGGQEPAGGRHDAKQGKRIARDELDLWLVERGAAIGVVDRAPGLRAEKRDRVAIGVRHPGNRWNNG